MKVVSVLSAKVRRLIGLVMMAMSFGGYIYAQSPVTIDTSNANLWVISNGTLSVHWLPGDGRVIVSGGRPLPMWNSLTRRTRTVSGPKASTWITPEALEAG